MAMTHEELIAELRSAGSVRYGFLQCSKEMLREAADRLEQLAEAGRHSAFVSGHFTERIYAEAFAEKNGMEMRPKGYGAELMADAHKIFDDMKAERDAALRQLAALRPVAEAAQWRPIETAPKVTRVLIRYKCGVVEIASLRNTPNGYVWTGDDGETDEARPDADSDPRTHWMPLPDEAVRAYQGGKS